MSRRTRVVVGLTIIELLLAGGWAWLHNFALTSSRASPEATQVIGQTFGAAMGIILALSPLLYIVARRNDLKGK